MSEKRNEINQSTYTGQNLESLIPTLMSYNQGSILSHGFGVVMKDNTIKNLTASIEKMDTPEKIIKELAKAEKIIDKSLKYYNKKTLKPNSNSYPVDFSRKKALEHLKGVIKKARENTTAKKRKFLEEVKTAVKTTE